MAEAPKHRRLDSFSVTKRFGVPRHFGYTRFALSHFGEDDICMPVDNFGFGHFGECLFGGVFVVSGVWRRDKNTGETLYYVQPYHWPKNPRSESQQVGRLKFADAILAWFSGLFGKSIFGDCYFGDFELKQKSIIDRRHCSRYNIFIRKYLLSN